MGKLWSLTSISNSRIDRFKRPWWGASFFSATSFVLLSAACQSGPDAEVAAWLGTDRINREISLTLMNDDPASVRLNGSVFLLVRNHSVSAITLPPDFGSVLLVYSEVSGEWQEIENRVEYPSDELITLSPRGELPFDERTLTVAPDREASPDLTFVRVAVVGENQNGETVAAYLEIPLGGL